MSKLQLDKVSGSPRKTLQERVDAVLQTTILPLLKIHGGGVTLLSLDPDSGHVELEFDGACRGCAFQTMTYVVSIRQRLLEIPDVTEVTMRGLRVSKVVLRRTQEMYKNYSFQLGSV